MSDRLIPPTDVEREAPTKQPSTGNKMKSKDHRFGNEAIAFPKGKKTPRYARAQPCVSPWHPLRQTLLASAASRALEQSGRGLNGSKPMEWFADTCATPRGLSDNVPSIQTHDSIPITHGGAPRGQKLCKCARCGIVERCTPAHDFYTTTSKTGPLLCEACFRQYARNIVQRESALLNLRARSPAALPGVTCGPPQTASAALRALMSPATGNGHLKP